MSFRILIFMPSLAGGGAERTVVNIINGLVRLGVDVTLILGKEKAESTHSSKYLELLPKEVSLRYLNVESRRKKLLGLILGLRKFIKEVQPDVIFSTRVESNLITVLSSIGTRCKLVVRESNHRSASIKLKAIRWLIGFTYNKADRIICLSDGVKNDLVDNFGVSEKKTVLIYNPIDLGFIASKLSVSRKREFSKKCVFIGRLDTQKQPEQALEAFKLYKQQYSEATMRILGVGRLESSLRAKVLSYGLESSVCFDGFVDNPYAVLAESDFLIMTSQYEGFGHVIVEAMACGAIPVVYDCESGPSEILSGALSSLLVKTNDYQSLARKLTELSLDENHRAAIHKQIKSRATDFSSEVIVKQYYDVFFKA